MILNEIPKYTNSQGYRKLVEENQGLILDGFSFNTNCVPPMGRGLSPRERKAVLEGQGYEIREVTPTYDSQGDTLSGAVALFSRLTTSQKQR